MRGPFEVSNASLFPPPRKETRSFSSPCIKTGQPRSRRAPGPPDIRLPSTQARSISPANVQDDRPRQQSEPHNMAPCPPGGRPPIHRARSDETATAQGRLLPRTQKSNVPTAPLHGRKPTMLVRPVLERQPGSYDVPVSELPLVPSPLRYHPVHPEAKQLGRRSVSETTLRMPSSLRRHGPAQPSQDSIEETINLGMITISEETDSDCVRRGSEGSVSPSSAEDALLQVISTTLQLLETGKEADICRSCAAFVQSAKG